MKNYEDYNLAKYINHLINEDRIIEFYKSSRWHKMRLHVLKDIDHYECYDCASKGILKKAVLVHHINEVKDRPELALSPYYIDKYGVEKRNLVSLCFNCHEKRHNRCFTSKRDVKKYSNKEWW